MTKSQQMADRINALYKELNALEEKMKNDAEKEKQLKKQIESLEKDFVKAFGEDVNAGLIQKRKTGRHNKPPTQKGENEMKTAERMMYYNENRKQECEDLENRIGVLIKNLTEFQKKVAWAKTAGCGDNVNIGTHYTREFANQLQMLTRNVEEIERCSAILEVLKKQQKQNLKGEYNIFTGEFF